MCETWKYSFKSRKFDVGRASGICVGPQLFNLFVNELFYNAKKAKLSAYADDKQLYFSHREALTLQHTLNSELAFLSNWISDNVRSHSQRQEMWVPII